MRSLWFAAAALTLHGVAAAQSVYRCGPDGRIYQQTPCADGRAIDASDARSPEQRAAAQAVAEGEARRAAQFDRDNAAAAAPENRKAKPPKAPKAAASGAPGSAASAPKNEKSAPRNPSKPLTVRLPAKPKAAASAASK